MRRYDRSFGIIAKHRGFISSAVLQLAEVELARHHEAGSDATLASVLMSAGVLDDQAVLQVEETMARHAFDCPTCGRTTFMLPGEREDDIRCEHCNSKTFRRRVASARLRRRATVSARVERVPTDRVERAPAPVRVERAPAPVRVERAPAAVRVERAQRVETPFIPPAAGPSPFELLDSVPRAIWAICAVLCAVFAFQPLGLSMKIMGMNGKIRAELMKLKAYPWDVKTAAIDILAREGVSVKPEEVQVLVFQDIKKDAHIFGYVTVKSESAKIHFQAVQNVTSRDTVENAYAAGIPFVQDDFSKVWPDAGDFGRHFQTLGLFTVALMFAVMTVKLGGSAGR